MIYEIRTVLPDPMAQLPPFVFDENDPCLADEMFGDYVVNEFYNDYGHPFSVGTTVTIERIG